MSWYVGGYAGGYASSKRSGTGIMRLPDGGLYQGQFAEDKFEGQGQYEYVDGSTYVGEWKAGKKHGQVSHATPRSSSAVMHCFSMHVRLGHLSQCMCALGICLNALVSWQRVGERPGPMSHDKSRDAAFDEGEY